MNNELTQEEQIALWVKERDSILADLYINKKENERLISENKDLDIALKEAKSLLNKLNEDSRILTEHLNENQSLVSEIAKNKNENNALMAIKNELNTFILSQREDINLKSWASERDAILKDIAVKKTENEDLIIKNSSLAKSNTEIQDKINKNLGILEELDKKEKERKDFIGMELSNLLVQKQQIEVEIIGLKNEINCLEKEKDLLKEMIGTLTKANEKVFNKTTEFEKILGEVVSINSQNAREVENILINAGLELKKIIDINSQNVEKTNVVINDLPKIIFDLQRDIIERKKFNKTKQ